MRIVKEDFANIGSHFAPYLVNSDPTGLEEGEVILFDEWYARNVTNEGYDDCLIDVEEEEHFSFDSVSKLWGNCYTAHLVKWADD